MEPREAIALLRGTVPGTAGVWADLGAGEGTFTRALVALLGPTARVYAVDRDPDAIAALRRWAGADAPGVIPVEADFSQPFVLPGLGDAALDGVLLANSLHFVPGADDLLERIASLLRPGGRLVLVEYDQRRATRWVPHPVPPERFTGLAAGAGFTEPAIAATRESRYGGTLYVAAAERRPAGAPASKR